ncbi:hypothetical protein EDD11_003317 [Mortierella claussenii]|nr:hypothetical protein EDD11_003317 [Mortierella claussenii]
MTPTANDCFNLDSTMVFHQDICDKVLLRHGTESMEASSSVEPDFILEEGVPGVCCRTLRELWPQLDEALQNHLMQNLVKTLATIWNSFDILGGKADAEGHIDESHGLFTNPAEETSKERKEEEEENMEEEHHAHEQTRLFSLFDKAEKLDSSNQEEDPDTHRSEHPIRLTPLENLRQAEDAFLIRSFFDAFKEATETSMAAPMQGLIRNLEHFSECQDSRQAGQSTSTRWSHPLSLDCGIVSQRMSTTKARAQDSLAIQEEASVPYIQPLSCSSAVDYTQVHAQMHQFDFSLDDFLIQVRMPQEDGISSTMLALPRIVGVSRWKTFCPVLVKTPESTANHQFMDPQDQSCPTMPRSTNAYQVMAQPSNYPLIHLFTLPDVFCPTEFGGQDASSSVEMTMDTASTQYCGLAYNFTRLLMQHSPGAADFLTSTVRNKELRLYHRWLKSWHEYEREPSFSSLSQHQQQQQQRQQQQRRAIRARFEKIRAQRDQKKIEAEVQKRRERQESLRQRQQQPDLAQMCPRCKEEGTKQEMVAQDRAFFDETARFLEEITLDEDVHTDSDDEYKDNSQDAGETAEKDACAPMGREAELMQGQDKAQEAQMAQMARLLLQDGLWDDQGRVAAEEREQRPTSQQQQQRQGQTGVLSKEEQALMRMKLFGNHDAPEGQLWSKGALERMDGHTV